MVNWNSFQHNFHHALHRISYFFLQHSNTHHHRYWIYQTICPAKSIKFIIKLYTDHNNLWVKHITHQKAESLRAASLSILGNTINNKLSSIQGILNSLQNGKCSLIFRTLLMHITTPTISIKNAFLFSQFWPLLIKYYVIKHFILLKI